MSTTRLKRKHRKNIARANNKQRIIKQLLLTPVLKNVDIEELKAGFSSGRPNIAPKAQEVTHAPKPETTPAPAAADSELESNAESQVNQNGDTGFDAAEAVTKKVNEDGQSGEHPKPEIEL